MYTSEGTEEDAEKYLHHVYPIVKCTFQLSNWPRDGYKNAPPVFYKNITRDQAFTKIVYALHTSDPDVNPMGKPYKEVHTLGIAQKVTVPRLRRWAEKKFDALHARDSRRHHYCNIIDLCSWATIPYIKGHLAANKKIAEHVNNQDKVKIIENTQHFIETGEEI